jgi:hypothetical protein
MARWNTILRDDFDVVFRRGAQTSVNIPALSLDADLVEPPATSTPPRRLPRPGAVHAVKRASASLWWLVKLCGVLVGALLLLVLGLMAVQLPVFVVIAVVQHATGGGAAADGEVVIDELVKLGAGAAAALASGVGTLHLVARRKRRVAARLRRPGG